MKKTTLIKVCLALCLVSFAKALDKTAEDLVNSMKKEDITYAQLMSTMSMAINNIQAGIISMNKFQVDRGIDLIRTHPAPKKKPWFIMAKENRDAFKSTLVYFDKKMDEDVLFIEKAVEKKDWNKALVGLNEFNNTCMSCHITWKNEVKYIME